MKHVKLSFLPVNIGIGVLEIVSTWMIRADQWSNKQNNVGGRTHGAVCARHVSVPLSHAGNVITRIGLHQQQLQENAVLWEKVMNDFAEFWSLFICFSVWSAVEAGKMSFGIHVTNIIYLIF